MKKQFLLPLVAVIAVLGIAFAGTAFKSEVPGDTTSSIFRFKGTAETSQQLTDPAKWEEVGGDDEMVCTGGETICTLEIASLPVYGAPYNTPEQRLAHYLDLESDDGVSIVNTEENIVSEKN